MTVAASTGVRVGQVWASTHKGDVAGGFRQARVVVHVDASVAYFGEAAAAGEPARVTSRVRLRQTSRCRMVIPGHRLVEDVPA